MSIFLKNKNIFRIFTLLWIVFIFWNSLHAGDSSEEMSGAVLELLSHIPFLRELTDFIVRKCAHFIEFFVLGALLTISLRPEHFAVRGAMALPAFFCLFVPLMDETIQLFVEGRNGQVSDVMLDFSGALCGLLLMALLFSRLHQLRYVKPLPYNRRRLVILLVLMVLGLLFIWGNSAQPTEVTHQQSETVRESMESVATAAPAVTAHLFQDDYFVRKAAHFFEFACLGVLLAALAVTVLGYKREALFAAAFGGLLTAVIDEWIQLFIEGRSGLVKDVWLDCGGILTGILLLVLVYIVRRRRKTG